MIKGWVKPLIVSLVVSLLLSTLVVVSITLLISTDSHALYLRFVERVAGILSLHGEYAENLRVLGPVPESGSGFLGRIWIVGPSGTVLATNSTESPPDAALALLPTIDRSVQHPVEVKRQRWSIGADLFLLPMPDHRADTLILHKLRQGPVSQWLRTIVLLVFALSFVLCLASWAMVMALMRHRSKGARAVMQAIAQGALGRRLTTGTFDELSGLSLDFNAMADRIEGLVNDLTRIEASRSEWLRHLAHDIRTPLTSLRTATETLSAEGALLTAEDRASLVRVAHAEALYLGRLVEDLFYLSELGARPEVKEPIDVGAVIRGLVEQRQVSTAYPQLRWEMELEDAGSLIELDVTRLTRLVTNLFDNAEKHARRSVRVTLARLPQAIRLAVRDDGPGMSEDAMVQYGKDRPRRMDCTQAASASLGLGSAIVRSIVEQWNGTLTLANHPEGGLEVVVEWRTP